MQTEKTIRVSYATTTTESILEGEFEETGWVNEVEIQFKDDEEETAIEEVVRFLTNRNVIASNSHFNKGTFYTEEEGSRDIDYWQNGVELTHSFHLTGFTETEEEEIFKAVSL